MTEHHKRIVTVLSIVSPSRTKLDISKEMKAEYGIPIAETGKFLMSQNFLHYKTKAHSSLLKWADRALKERKITKE